MRPKQRYLIFWMVVGALIGVVAMVLIERAGIPNFDSLVKTRFEEVPAI